MNISVVIPYHNGSEFIVDCLSSVASSSCKVSQVVLVDNSPEPLPRETISKELSGLPLEIIPTAASIGFGRACNIGLEYALEAEPDVIVLLNQDTKLDSNCLALLCSEIVNNPKTFSAFPIALNHDMSDIHQKALTRYTRAIDDYFKDLVLGTAKERYSIEFNQTNASCCALNPSALRALPHFDPIFWMYGEERDLFRRAKQLGYDLTLIPAARLGHRHANFSDSEDKVSYFKPLIRNAQQINTLKDTQNSLIMALLETTKFSVFSFIRFAFLFGPQVVFPCLKSDLNLVQNLPALISNRDPNKLQLRIKRQISIDRMDETGSISKPVLAQSRQS